MTSEVERDLHRTVEPAARLIVAGIFALISLAIAIFQLSGKANQWLDPNIWLWVVAMAAIVISIVVYALPIRRPRRTEGAALKLRPQPQESTDRAYGVNESVSFYDHVADIYDARLTRQYLDTMRAAADLLLERFPDSSRRLSLLDIGAGTGQFIRLLEGSKRVQWTCLEPAQGMAAVLRRFFEGPPLAPTIYEIGLEDADSYLNGRKFDAISMNSLLSSLALLPDFGRLAGLLAEDGVLLISDGHPDIKAENRSFRIRALDGIHSLQIEHRASAEIAIAVTRSGHFEQVGNERNITKAGRLYSYVLCFRRRTTVLED